MDAGDATDANVDEQTTAETEVETETTRDIKATDKLDVLGNRAKTGSTTRLKRQSRLSP